MYLNAVIFSRLQKLYQQIDDSNHFLTFAPITTSFSNLEFNFLNPNPASADELKQNIEYKMAFAQIANAIIRDPKLFQILDAELMQDSYSKILNSAILIDTTISDADKLAFNNAKAILYTDDNFDPTPEYAAYNVMSAKAQDLDSQVLKVNALLSAAGTDDEAALLQQKQQLELQKSVLLNDWLVNGNKDKIENALKIVSGLNERGAYKSSFNNEIVNLKTTISTETTINSGIDFLPAFCLPEDVYKYDFNGWQKISITGDEITSLENDAKTFLGDTMYNANDTTNAAPEKIEFEYLFVTVKRNWYKEELVNSQFWKFNTADDTIVSDGVNVTTGIMPAYAEKFIFVRRIMQYISLTDANPAPQINNTTPASYKFSDIAGLKNFSLLKNIQPVQANISKVRIANQGAQISTPVLMHFAAPASTVTAAPIMHNAAIIAGDNSQQKVMMKPRGGIILTHIPVSTTTAGTAPQAPKVFDTTFVFNDGAGNPVTSLDVTLTNTADLTQFAAISDNGGKIFFANMPVGNYHLMISHNELFEDFENTYNVNSSTTNTINLTKKQNPAFDMWLIGAINFQLPKLPDPLENYTYS